MHMYKVKDSRQLVFKPPPKPVEHKPEEIVTQEELNRQEENNIRFLETLKLAGRREGIRLAQMQAQAQRSPIDHEKVNAW